MSTEQHNPPATTGTSATPVPAAVSRRAVLSGARAAVPAIVTLYSGAALARTSANLVSTSYNEGTSGGKYNCLDTEGLPRVRTNTYDIGKPPMAHVTRINSYRTYYKPGWNGQPSNTAVSKPDMCKYGGEYFRKDWGRYTKVTVKKGGMVSGTAMGSFSNVTTYTDV
jgi:hypothetical protein